MTRGGAIEADRPRATEVEGDRRGRRSRPYETAVAVLVVGLAVVGVLTWLSAREYTRTEKRLLTLRADDVGAALTSALPSIQTPLASAAALADATNGSPAKFKRFIAPYVDQASGGPFSSVSLWRLSDLARGPVAVAGLPPALPSTGVAMARFFAHAAASSKLTVVGLLDSPHPALGYAFSGMASGPFVAYGEALLPPRRYSPPQKGQAFSDLDYALYLGASTRPADLLIASLRRLPLPGRHSTVNVPFGETSLTVVVSSRGSLAGSLPPVLPWIIAIVGTLLTLGASALVTRLIERRRATERIADQLEEIARENERLYNEQRGIAQTLQRALLPRALPQPPGLQVSARYEAGAEGVEVGGDWYDLIELDDGCLLLVVGDVSGRGLPAATAMAALRFAIHAYAADGDTPASFLPKLSRLISVTHDRLLATVLCAMVDVRHREVSVTSAGHLPPLLITRGSSEFVDSPVGLPVGVAHDAAYTSATISAPAGATLLAFTDGLVERRGETIDVGLERLRSEASANHVPLDQLLARVLACLREDAPPDDIAVAGIRWMS